MEIKDGDYVKYEGKIYSVGDSRYSICYLIGYKDLDILTNIPKSEVERLTDFHVSVMRFNKTLPPRRFKVGDMVKLRADLDSKCFWGNTFRDLGFEEGKKYDVTRLATLGCLVIKSFNVHEFEVELVEGS